MNHKPAAAHQITGIHAKDIDWIIALWFAIHGGDPVPEHLTPAQTQKAAAELIRAAAAHLDIGRSKAVAAALHG